MTIEGNYHDKLPALDIEAARIVMARQSSGPILIEVVKEFEASMVLRTDGGRVFCPIQGTI